MNHFPVGIMAKGFLHGFATLYGIFCVGSLFIFGMSFLIPEGIIRIVVMGISLIGFFTFCTIAIVLRCKKPEIFSVREDYYLTIKTEGAKTPDGKLITEITQLEKPKRRPRITSGGKGKGKIQ